LVIVDTTVWIDYLANRQNPETEWLDRELVNGRIGLTSLILCEVLQGIADESEFRTTHTQLRFFFVFETGTEALAVASARNFRLLRRHGHTVRKTIDCLIATFCIEARHELLHRDRDFDAFEKFLGLAVIHP
jgi:predicted nucleic acid-binding protein